ELSVAYVACKGERRFGAREGLVHPQFGVRIAEIPEHPAFAMPIAVPPCQCERRLVRRKCLLWLTEVLLEITQAVVSVALNALVVQFARNCQRRLELGANRFRTDRVVSEQAQTAQCATLGASVACGAGPCQRAHEF